MRGILIIYTRYHILWRISIQIFLDSHWTLDFTGLQSQRCGSNSKHDHCPPYPTCGDSPCIHEQPHRRSDHDLSFHHNRAPSMQQLRWNSLFLFALRPSQSQGGNSEITLCFSHSTFTGPIRNSQIPQEPGKPDTWCRFSTAPIGTSWLPFSGNEDELSCWKVKVLWN